MREDENQWTCEETRGELAGHLYGELGDSERARVETHLASCDACRAEYEGLLETRNLLDTWSPYDVGSVGSVGSEDAGAVAREVARAIAPRPARSSTRPVLLAVAAAVLAFLGLASLGAELDYSAGHCTVRFGLPWVPVASATSLDPGPGVVSDSERPAEWRELVREVAHEQLATTLEGWSLREEEQRMRLARAIDSVREQDQATLAALVQAVQRGTLRENRFTREALFELASLVDEQEH